MSYDPSEQNAITAIFAEMLDACTKDGGNKRAAGTKVDWRVDPSHEAAIFSHLNKWKHGEKVDADSGAHPLVHLAWRALAIAYQETHPELLSMMQYLAMKKWVEEPVLDNEHID